jgi:hypothetical protein
VSTMSGAVPVHRLLRSLFKRASTEQQNDAGGEDGAVVNQRPVLDGLNDPNARRAESNAALAAGVRARLPAMRFEVPFCRKRQG